MLYFVSEGGEKLVRQMSSHWEWLLTAAHSTSGKNGLLYVQHQKVQANKESYIAALLSDSDNPQKVV